MKSLPTLAAVLAAGLTLAGCVSAVENKEDMLSAAGFVPKPATTPAQVASLKSLPPHKFSMQTKNGKTIYIYPDPTVCNCLYVGSQSDFQQYQQMMYKQHLANEQEMAAMINEDIVDDNYNWGVWGPPWWGPPGTVVIW